MGWWFLKATRTNTTVVKSMSVLTHRSVHLCCCVHVWKTGSRADHSTETIKMTNRKQSVLSQPLRGFVFCLLICQNTNVCRWHSSLCFGNPRKRRPRWDHRWHLKTPHMADMRGSIFRPFPLSMRANSQRGCRSSNNHVNKWTWGREKLKSAE